MQDPINKKGQVIDPFSENQLMPVITFRMQDTFISQEKKVKGIIFFNKSSNRRPALFNHIDNTQRGLPTFMNTMKNKWPHAEYVNFYSKLFLKDGKGIYLGRKYF